MEIPISKEVSRQIDTHPRDGRPLEIGWEIREIHGIGIVNMRSIPWWRKLLWRIRNMFGVRVSSKRKNGMLRNTTDVDKLREKVLGE